MSSKRGSIGSQATDRAGRKRLRAADVVVTSSSAASTSGGGAEGASLPPVRCTATAYGLSGQHVSRYFPETGRVWQVQFEHAAKPSMTFGILKNWLEFKNGLRRTAGKEEAPTLEGIEREDGLRLILTGAEDEHAFGYKQWQCGVYAHDPEGAGVARLVALLHHLAGFFAFVRGTVSYRNGGMPGLQWATRDPALAAALSEALKESIWTRAAVAAHVFDLHPPQGKAGLVLSLEGVPDTDAVNFLFTGHTWPWRAALDGAGIAGGYVEEPSGAKTYVRMQTGVRVAETEEAGRLRKLLSEVLRSFPILLRPVDEEDRANAAVAGARAWLLGLPNIFER